VAVSQIFTNLVGNAIKYRSADRAVSITITGEVNGKKAVYAVTDNGSGISEADLGKVCNIFFRGGKTQQQSGEGIGLATVKRLAERSGGSVRVESKEGEGSSFFIELPSAGKLRS